MFNKLICLLYLFLSTYFFDSHVNAKRWSPVMDESLDERHDAEIFRAVFESMKQWESHKKTSFRTKREISRVCYEDVGCFEDTGPFSYLEMLPSPPKDVGTRFFVYGSRKARSVPMEVSADDINTIEKNAIDPELPTKIIVHGFGSDCDNIWVYEMRSALMSVHDCNIVCVDWSPGSAIPNYVRAAANTRLVGRQLAKFIRSLNVPLNKVHMIGFSLGAHVAGFAGAELANVSRITGLDPAGPLFETQDPLVRLDNMDAHFVDVIHSNGEQLILGGLGSWQPMGDVDFYPNGGRMQTGCSNLFLGAVSDFIWSSSIEGRSLCNHRRAYKLFTDSVSPKCRFPAFPCEKGYDGLLQGECFPCGPDRLCGDMGYYSDTSSARGQLYLITREEEPFCALQYQIKVFNSHRKRPTKSYGKLQITLVGSGSLNETFTMTRKDDEELLVGTILHKIVVPHPVVVNLKAVEIKYTAYSGWISSGLVSWNIDKVSVVDSFGRSISVCKKNLALESGHSVYLLLYPGECNIPLESDNYTSIDSSFLLPESTTAEVNAIKKTFDVKIEPSNIGPFTKNQNFEPANRYSVLTFSSENSNSQRNFGPFTKDQNLKMSLIDDTNSSSHHQDQRSVKNDSSKDNSNFWLFADVNDTGLNLLENPVVESGRGFSGAEYILSTSTSSTVPTDSIPSVEFHSEIHEPVLQINKHETGRSMRLPEITEPLLRPRITKNIKVTENSETTEKNLEHSCSDCGNEDNAQKGFTVQFLPERLANILEQAERYARRTFLPLISQYTPSFIDGQQENLKYFPSLINASEKNGSISSYDFHPTSITNEYIHEDSQNTKEIKALNQSEKDVNFNSLSTTNSTITMLSKSESYKIPTNSSYNDSSFHSSRNFKSIEQSNNWVPVNRSSSNGGSIKSNPVDFRPLESHEEKWVNKVIDTRMLQINETSLSNNDYNNKSSESSSISIHNKNDNNNSYNNATSATTTTTNNNNNNNNNNNPLTKNIGDDI